MYIPPVTHTSKPNGTKSKQVSGIDVTDKVRSTTAERRRKRDRRRKQSFITFNDRRRPNERRLTASTQRSSIDSHAPNVDAIEDSSLGNNIDITI